MGKSVEPKTVVFYEAQDGRRPFSEWLEGLRDRKGRERIMTRIARLTQGHYGDCESVGEGVSEMRMFFGIIRNLWFWPCNPMELIGNIPCDFPGKECLLVHESRLFLNSLTLLFDVAGFRPGSRVTFLSGKVTKAIDAQPGLMP